MNLFFLICNDRDDFLRSNGPFSRPSSERCAPGQGQEEPPATATTSGKHTAVAEFRPAEAPMRVSRDDSAYRRRRCYGCHKGLHVHKTCTVEARLTTTRATVVSGFQTSDARHPYPAPMSHSCRAGLTAVCRCTCLAGSCSMLYKSHCSGKRVRVGARIGGRHCRLIRRLRRIESFPAPSSHNAFLYCKSATERSVQSSNYSH